MTISEKLEHARWELCSVAAAYGLAERRLERADVRKHEWPELALKFNNARHALLREARAMVAAEKQYEEESSASIR